LAELQARRAAQSSFSIAASACANCAQVIAAVIHLIDVLLIYLLDSSVNRLMTPGRLRCDSSCFTGWSTTWHYCAVHIFNNAGPEKEAQAA
jgi:hypothetical protein